MIWQGFCLYMYRLLNQQINFDETPTKWQISASMRRLERQASWGKAFLLIVGIIIFVDIAQTMLLYSYFGEFLSFYERALKLFPATYVLLIMAITFYVLLVLAAALLSIRLASNMNRLNFALHSRNQYLKMQGKEVSNDEAEERKQMYGIIYPIERDSEFKFPWAMGLVSILVAAFLVNLFTLLYGLMVFNTLQKPL